ncbi:phosphatase [Streptomyces gardneri]|uniref:phosphatase n=1 Tax=Nocardia TaxID=1817 RepID=UPI001894E645|nr:MULTISPECIES: phosphatase [Nocardia]MBF6167478.1 phosphatase [Streptomyces gardneri]MBF6204433.1 phosphatase [Streptomyces gardneri]
MGYATRPGRSDDRELLRKHLLETRIAGDVATPREGNLSHYRKMVEKEPRYQFGLTLRDWTFDETLAMMARLCGVSPDPRHLRGPDTIDAELTLDALDAMGARIGLAARRRETVILATGHPETLMDVYRAVEDALRAAGCVVLTPAAGWSYRVTARIGSQNREIVYTSGVAALGDDGRLKHTHDPHPMRAVLRELRDAGAGHWPDLVIADHGWAGAAGEAGIETVGFADSNDPALFAGQVEGKIAVTVPLDDGVHPEYYRPLTTYLLDRAGLGG